jgi:hypothetical protein
MLRAESNPCTRIALFLAGLCPILGGDQGVIDARAWSGTHFRTADVQGAVLDKKVARAFTTSGVVRRGRSRRSGRRPGGLPPRRRRPLHLRSGARPRRPCRWRPPGTDGVDEDAVTSELGGEHSRKCVERSLRGRVGGSSGAHARERARSARHVDDARVRAAAKLWQQRLRQPPGAKDVCVEDPLRADEVGVARPLPGVIADRRVVDEDIESID